MQPAVILPTLPDEGPLATTCKDDDSKTWEPSPRVRSLSRGSESGPAVARLRERPRRRRGGLCALAAWPWLGHLFSLFHFSTHSCSPFGPFGCSLSLAPPTSAPQSSHSFSTLPNFAPYGPIHHLHLIPRRMAPGQGCWPKSAREGQWEAEFWGVPVRTGLDGNRCFDTCVLPLRSSDATHHPLQQHVMNTYFSGLWPHASCCVVLFLFLKPRSDHSLI